MPGRDGGRNGEPIRERGGDQYPDQVGEWRNDVVIPRVGLLLSQSSPKYAPPLGEFERLVDVAKAAEASGFDSLWVDDDDVPVPGGQIRLAEARPFAPYTLLGALAARTSTAALAVCSGADAARAPSIVAKLVSTIDVLSHGRAILTLGASHDNDPSSKLRLAEELQICLALLTEEVPSFTGRYHRIAGAPNLPRPPDGHQVPLVVVTDRIDLLDPVARFADALVVTGTPPQVAQVAGGLRRECIGLGRDPGQITVLWRGELSIHADGSDGTDGSALIPGHLQALVDAGVTGFVIEMAHPTDRTSVERAGTMLAEAVTS